VGETLARSAGRFPFPSSAGPGLSLSGLPFWPAQSFSTAGANLVMEVLTPNFTSGCGHFDWTDAEEPLFAPAGWSSSVQVGVMLYLNIDLLLANRLFRSRGKRALCRRAATVRHVVTLGMTVGEIFAPTMYQMYARGDIDGLAFI